MCQMSNVNQCALVCVCVCGGRCLCTGAGVFLCISYLHILEGLILSAVRATAVKRSAVKSMKMRFGHISWATVGLIFFVHPIQTYLHVCVRVHMWFCADSMWEGEANWMPLLCCQGSKLSEPSEAKVVESNARLMRWGLLHCFHPSVGRPWTVLVRLEKSGCTLCANNFQFPH